MKKLTININQTFQNRRILYSILKLLLICSIVFIQYFQVHFSALPSVGYFRQQDLIMIPLNFAIVLLPNLLLVILLQRWTLSLSVSSVFLTIWSIADYFVTKFHGSPLLPSELANMKTAMNVASGYHYSIDIDVIHILSLFLLELLVLYLLHALQLHEPFFRFKKLIFRILLFAVDGALIFLALFGPTPLKPRNSMGWTWRESVIQYGYFPCFIENIEHVLNPFVVPENYSPEQIDTEQLVAATDNTNAITDPDEMPNIILILNETFSDLDVFSDVQADTDYFKDFYSIENAVFGHAITPSIGGGTNNSEYELLTSNSLFLLNNDAPFNYINFDKTKSNVVQYLKGLGYESFVMHCENKRNYSRNIAYPALGFDHLILGNESFQYYHKYGKRRWLDSDNYLDLIDQYESAGDQPRFMYLLTYQNHGGYEQNKKKWDTVHTGSDFGDRTDDVNEYLTSVSMSVQAFKELTDYFSEVDRPTIICMVGDHMPDFIGSLTPNREFTWEERQIAMRTVPYVIWSNYGAEFPEYTEYTTMTDLIPMVIKTANLPLTPFYQSMVDLHNLIPVHTSTGVVMDQLGRIAYYNPEYPYFDSLTRYYYLEYNSLKAGKEYLKDIFELPE